MGLLACLLVLSLFTAWPFYIIPSEASIIQVSGTSMTDAYDRVVSVNYRGIEVARLMTPDRQTQNGCVLVGGLCNWFSLLVTLPFSASGLTATMSGSSASAWSLGVAGGPLGSAQVSSVIPFQKVLSAQQVNFSLPSLEVVFFILSGHSQCENASPDSLKVDGGTKPFLNWSYGPPLASGQRFTEGVVIPYVEMRLSAGPHTLTASCGASGASYILVSAFSVPMESELS